MAQALPPGGRLVVNAVTLETEAILIAPGRPAMAAPCCGCRLSAPTRSGGLTGWRPAMPVVQWSVTK